MIGTAWAADAAHSESIFSDPAFWVAVSCMPSCMALGICHTLGWLLT